MTKAKQKTKEPMDLPSGWTWDKNSTGWKAINPEKNLETTPCTTLKAAVAAAHRIDEQYGAERGLAQEDKDDETPFPTEFRNGLARGTAPITTPVFLTIPIDQIAPSPTNPRKFFDPAKLQELADSIEAHGLIEPILVRPRPVPVLQDVPHAKMWDLPAYELIAGERRWRAAQLAGLTEIEAKVRDLDDRAALEIQLIENLQREDVSPIEEAEGYSRMLELKNPDGTPVYTVDSLAAKIGKKGKSRSYVYGRLKLRNLPAPALKALAKGDLPASIGELIGRLPNEKMREELWADMFGNIGSEWFQMPSFRDVKATIEDDYMRELKSAPFSRSDAKLLPEAGACKNCPKMTGNNRGDYPDGRADLCTDTSCFELKLQAFSEREAEKARAAGARVLSEKEAEQIFYSDGEQSWIRYEAKKKYAPLEEKCYEDKEGRSYAELLDGHITPVVAIDPQGKSHLLAPIAEAEKVLKDVHGIKPITLGGHTADYKASEKKRQEEKKLRQATAAEIVTRALASDVDEELFNHDKFLRILAEFLIEKGVPDVAMAIGKRRGLDLNPADVRGSVTAIIPDLDKAEVLGLVVEWLLQRELEYWANWGSKDVFILCNYFGLKPEVVMREVAARQKAEKKPKSKPKAVAQA